MEAKSKNFRFIFSAIFCLSSFATAASATPRDQAYQIFNRLNGVPPSAEKLKEMENLIAAGSVKEAAMAAINDTNGMFYDLFLKGIFSRWSNADKSPRVQLNDFVATAIGFVRDDLPFDQALSADVVFTGNAQGAPAYSLANNDHYAYLENQGLALHKVLQSTRQSAAGGFAADATAGLMTTRGFAEAYFKAGTNRRAVAFSLDIFLCNEMEQLMDTTRADIRVRRDVTRAPGGDSSLFRNRCSGCHSGMDAFGGAFAFYDWNDSNTFIYTNAEVRPKYNRNTTEFPDGYVTTDDSWINLWTEGPNKSLGWKGPTEGRGAKSFGQMLATSAAFSQCMAKRAFQGVCLRMPTEAADLDLVSQLANSFRSSGFKMKDLFAETAVRCLQ